MSISFHFVLSATPGLFYGQTTTPFGSNNLATLKATNNRLAWIPLALTDPAVTSLNLQQTWTAGAGAFLFLGQNIRNEAAFSAAVRVMLSEPPLENGRVFWLDNPNDRRDEWRVTAMRVDTGASTASVDTLTSFAFGYHEVVVTPGCQVSIDTDQALFRISGEIFLAARSGAISLNVVTGDITIPLATNPGQLQFPLALQQGSTAMDDLDIALRLFYPADTTDFPRSGLLNFLRYPIFDLTQSGFALAASLDPLAPADASRTSFTFEPGADVVTFYRTNVGQPVRFSFPAGSTGRLVFASMPGAQKPSARDAFYLVPDGAFAIAAPGTPPQQQPNMLCGANGAEFVELDATSVVTFAAGQPAFLGVLPVVGHDTAAAGPNLSGVATTSWAAIGSTQARLIYSAVPDGAGYYGPPAPDSTLRPYFPAAAAFLPAVGEASGPNGTYPVLPYAGVEAADFALYQLLETRVVSPQRRAAIHQINEGVPLALPSPMGALAMNAVSALAPVNPTPTTTVTPQGLLATFSQDRSRWSLLTVAQTDLGPLAFQNIGDPLRSALLTNQQFVVITSANSLAPFFGIDNTAEIARWQFLLDPAGWNQFGTILIVKNHAHTLQELVNDLSTWTLASEFNLSPLIAQATLNSVIQAANVSRAENSDFEYFVDTVVNDERWNGVFFLNAKVSVDQLPPDLEVLAAGIDPTRFVAHHFGVNQTPVDDTLSMKNSSLFGLIDYEDPTAKFPSPSPLDFRVVYLRALFHNSAVKNFSAQAALTLGQLFGAPALAGGSGTVVVNGSYEKHGAGQVFGLVQTSPSVFATADAVLQSVTIANTHASTTLPAASSDQVETVFAFWGSMSFQTLKTDDGKADFDLFSYTRLSFSNLKLSMTFSQSNPQSRTFTFDATALSFDESQSVSREKSLAGHFPIKIRSLLLSNAADPNSHPVSSGYLPVGLPLSLQALGTPSFGLEFDLNLGTLGALASSAGFGARIVLAWSPATTPGQFFVGLKIPGFSSGSGGASLMGVVKLKMYSLELVQATPGAFMLLLNGISLSFFGQSLPPNDVFDFYIFGDPNSKAGADTLGWYGDFKTT